ncbi:MAG: DUF1638 domain-containing protein [Desulfobacteraceae bacterium]|nr:DUF1638 domain-containing protein [Desulfobacteraceae bacterium]
MSSDNIEDKTIITPMTLVGCGILKKEIRHLIKKNNWPITTKFFDSGLHVNFNKLRSSLEKGLEQNRNSPTIVFYGTCHPMMEKMLEKWKTLRTPGQNCVEILIGKEIFTRELEQGAFFLMEDWARRFEHVTGMAFNDNPAITRKIFQMEHKYLLGLRTDCSSDFTDHAEKVSRLVGLPLRWMDAGLEHLEQTLEELIEQRKHLP